MHGFWRIAISSPRLSIADVKANAHEIISVWDRASQDEAAVVLFPELSLTGYTCADLFQQSRLLDACEAELLNLAQKSSKWSTFAIIGAPMRAHGRLFNVALVIGRGKVWGAVPKSHLPNYKEFYEKRWFSSGLGINNESILIGHERVPFGSDLLFRCDDKFTFGVEICEDLWSPISPSTSQCLAGAEIIFNASASNELVGKAEYREKLITDRSSRCHAAYAYVSSGVGESTTDLVFSGDGIICEDGNILDRNERFKIESQYRSADIDVQKLRMLRLAESTFSDFKWDPYRHVELGAPQGFSDWRRNLPKHPFVPHDAGTREQRCRDIFTMQSVALTRRLSHIKAKSAVIGVSGGLDSTLALLVTNQAVKHIPGCKLIAITMPGFGTTSRTKNNALELCKSLGAEVREIDITEACMKHFKDIGHDPSSHDLTFENVQARERTQILMDVANQMGGIVIGTGDLSELALGWSTYNGDHMSMYAVNCSIPKTLVRHLVAWFAESQSPQIKKLLSDVIDTPISPELLPTEAQSGTGQHTEELLGPYEVHDFYLYQMLRLGADPERMHFTATQAFRGQYDADHLRQWLKVFLTRFFNNQFKRSCVPDGPKVGTISLSPRGDWRMPSDASYKAWIS